MAAAYPGNGTLIFSKARCAREIDVHKNIQHPIKEERDV
jgi:hypothetical protein